MESPLKNTGMPSAMLPTVQAHGGQGGNFTMPMYGGMGASIPDNLSYMKVAAPAYNPGGGGGGGFGQNFGASLSSPQASSNIASGIGGIIQGLVGRKKRKREQREAQQKYDQMMSQYQQLDTSNIYAGVRNPYENIETNFENVYEDLTVNQQQAQFEAQQGAQQRADIMSNLRGASGGSGVAGLAQALANQGQIAAQRASASIGMQESQNQRLAAQGASQARAMEQQALLTRMTGASQAEQMRLQGEEQSRALEYQKTGTMLGMSQQDLAAKNEAIASANAALYGGIGQVAGQVMESSKDAMAMLATGSDRRLKKNISLIGKSPSGLNIYKFEYINAKYGQGLFQGVMSNEIPKEAVTVIDGYDHVYYSMLDVEFKQI